ASSWVDAYMGTEESYLAEFTDDWSCTDSHYTYDVGGRANVNVKSTIAKIQYQSGSNLVDISGTLYVLKGTSVSFRAIPNPSNDSFPSGNPTWGGSSGAAGAGQQISVTFNTTSSSATDYKTVIATAGNAKSVNVVVIEL